MTVETAEVIVPETWGCTVADVKRRLPHIHFGTAAVSSNALYSQGTTAVITDDVIQEFIYEAASRVSARIIRYEQVPERTRENLRTMARTVVADGAAHLVQTAWFPASANPNDGSAYAERLWERFTTSLESLGAAVDSEAASGPLSGSGDTTFYFPRPMFPDDELF